MPGIPAFKKRSVDRLTNRRMVPVNASANDPEFHAESSDFSVRVTKPSWTDRKLGASSKSDETNH